MLLLQDVYDALAGYVPSRPRFPNFPGSEGTISALVQLDQATPRKMHHNGHVGIYRIEYYTALVVATHGIKLHSLI